VPGGVGPLATVLFMERLVRLTDAARNQDHVETLVPDVAGQAAVSTLIYDGVKAGRCGDLTALDGVVAGLRSQGRLHRPGGQPTMASIITGTR
jgi:aspartate racemase